MPSGLALSFRLGREIGTTSFTDCLSVNIIDNILIKLQDIICNETLDFIQLLDRGHYLLVLRELSKL